ncbi:hypothetical protein BQ8420_23505 [Nocardiopsis sp. JB363]|nr:hypothetical protein BQ8420_23505 [Nocardiopsis sp. JB363]
MGAARIGEPGVKSLIERERCPPGDGGHRGMDESDTERGDVLYARDAGRI